MFLAEGNTEIFPHYYWILQIISLLHAFFELGVIAFSAWSLKNNSDMNNLLLWCLGQRLCWANVPVVSTHSGKLSVLSVYFAFFFFFWFQIFLIVTHIQDRVYNGEKTGSFWFDWWRSRACAPGGSARFQPSQERRRKAEVRMKCD